MYLKSKLKNSRVTQYLCSKEKKKFLCVQLPSQPTLNTTPSIIWIHPSYLHIPHSRGGTGRPRAEDWGPGPPYFGGFWSKIFNCMLSYYGNLHNGCDLLFVRLDIRTHLMVHCQISSDIFLVNLGIKSDIELSEVIWYSSDIYLMPFWQINDSGDHWLEISMCQKDRLSDIFWQLNVR